MKRIVIANEMGGGWGHLLPISILAREFVRKGCPVTLLCREPEKAATVFHGLGVDIGKSPPLNVERTGFSLNYAQNLWGNGYRDENDLRNRFSWWTQQFRNLKPGFILTDYAPTALLAGLSLDIPRGVFGTGFTVPPLDVPMPSLHPWIDTPRDVLERAEKKVLEAIRSIAPQVSSIAGMFEGALRFLEIFPEMDHYENRPCERFWGPVVGSAAGRDPDWPKSGKGPRVFIYLNAVNRCLDHLIRHVKKRGFPTLCIVSGMEGSERRKMDSETFRVGATFVDLHKVAADCDIAVTQGGMHTSAAMLLAGKPLLICPEQLEQMVLGYRMKQRGLCGTVGFFSEAETVTDVFDCVAEQGGFWPGTESFARTYRGYDPDATAHEMVGRCLAPQ